MKFKKIIKEIKGDLNKNDQITLPGSHEIWTVEKDEGDYFELTNNTSGEKAQLSKYKLSDVKKVPIFEYKTQNEKDAEIKRYKENIRKTKAEMKKYKKNSYDSKGYKTLKKSLERYEAALKFAEQQTPQMTIY